MEPNVYIYSENKRIGDREKMNMKRKKKKITIYKYAYKIKKFPD